MAQDNKPLESHLIVGARAIVVPHSKAPDAPRHVVTLRGWQSNRFLLFDCPAPQEPATGVVQNRPRRIALRAKSEVIVRIIFQGEAFAFRELISNIFYIDDVPYFSLRWPQQFETLRIRKHDRYPVETKCKIQLAAGEEVVGAARDISLGGCAIQLDRPVPRDTELVLWLALPDGTRLDEVHATVRSVREEAGAPIVGVQFVSLPDIEQRGLVAFIETVRVQGSDGDDASRPTLIVLAEAGSKLNGLVIPDFTVVAVTNVAEALHRVRGLRARALAIDCLSAKWSGPQVCALVRDNPNLQMLQIALLGTDPAADEAAARSMGADLAIPAPLGPLPAVADVVASHLNQPAASALDGSSFDLIMRADSPEP